jgi:nitrogen-specific signal transduction histidine kinase
MQDDSIKGPNTGNTGPKNLPEEILDTLWEPLLILEDDLRVQSANDAFYQHFKVEPAETVGRQLYDLGNGQWDIPRLRELLSSGTSRFSTPLNKSANAPCCLKPGASIICN